MKVDLNVDVRPLSRVEGHGNIGISIKDGKVISAKWEVVETPRFFEAMLIGKRWDNAPWVSGRICGICSIGHTIASIRGVENAFGIVPTDQTKKLRLLLKHTETLQSHVLHLYFLAAPDFLNVGSVFPLIGSNPTAVGRAAKLKLLANDICDLVGGRRLHPTTTVIGGFSMVPDKKELKAMSLRLKDSVADLMITAELFKTFKLPDFERQTEFVSLKSDDSYPFIGGDLGSTDGVRKKEHEYKAMTNEYKVPQSTAKWASLSRKSYAVGALARINNNYDHLHPAAKDVANIFGLKPVNHNPYMNNIAQLVECVHVVKESIDLIDYLIDTKWEEPKQAFEPKAGFGVGAVEVPRGILYHAYDFDDRGYMKKCDFVIPTGQNHANIQHDIEELARKYAENGFPDRKIELMAEMLVRSYDPCISCSVH